MKDERKKLGQWGEQKAKEYLLAQGYTLLEENWRNRFGEIDLIMLYKDIVVFIEVRTKTSNNYGTGLESITERKLKQIRKMATSYLQLKQKWDQSIRFDLVAIDKTIDTYNIQHIKNILQ